MEIFHSVILFILLRLSYVMQTIASASPGQCAIYVHPSTDESTEGKALIGETFSYVRLESLLLCAARCLRQTKCLSINYDIMEKVCALNNKTHLTAPNQFVAIASSSIVYHSISSWSKLLVGACAFHSCKSEEVCLPPDRNHGQPRYTCVSEEEVDIPAPSYNFSSTLSYTDNTTIGVIGDRRYQPFGCYYSPKNHALPNQVGNLRGSIDWNNMTGIIQWCAKLSTEYELFGIEFYGECYAALTTDDANLSAGTVASGDDYNLLCWHGVGANNVMYIYQWIN